MIEHATDGLAANGNDAHRFMVRDMAQRWPGERALTIAFAITSGAASLEDMVDTEDARLAARRGYRLAALVSADVYAIEAMGQIPATGHHLLHFWCRVDPYFLNL